MTQLLPPKKEVALALLERSNVDVYLDPRAQGVVVPPQFRKEPRLILKIGLNMPVPIPDLRVDDESMSCTLSFNRAKFFCIVPWQSVFAMVGDDGRGMVWPDDVPQELSVRTEDRPLSPVRDVSAPAPALVPAPPATQTATVTPLPLSAPNPSSASSSSSSSSTASRRGKGKSRIQPDAPPRETSAASAGRSKRPRKKKEEVTRPILHAVPPPEKSAPRVEKLDDRRESRDAAARESREGGNAASDRNQGASADHVERAPSAPSAPPHASSTNGRGRPTTPARPKRELPPYLRIVK